MTTTATKIYAVRFKRHNNSGELGEPILVADSGDLKTVGSLHWEYLRESLEAIQPGDCRVLDNARITRLPDFQQGAIMFDSHAKEHVKITNGSCVLSHFDGDARYREDHPNGSPCVYAPSEAIALRPFVHEKEVVIGFTYRAVNPCYLEPVKPEDVELISAQFSRVTRAEGDPKLKTRIIGRI